MKRLLMVSLFLVPGRAALAQSMDILDQQVTVDVSSSTTTVIELDVQLVATAEASELWILTPPLPVDVLAVDGESASMRPHPSYPELVRTITLPKALSSGDTATLYLRVSGQLDCASRLMPGTLACVRSSAETVLVPASPDVSWYAINLTQLDTFVGQVTVRAPEGFMVAAGQGAPKEETSDGVVKTVRFAYDDPTELLYVYAADASRFEAEGPTPVVGYARSGRPELMQEAVELAAELLPLYEERFGVAPVDQATIVAVPRGFPFGGIGLIGTILIGDYVVGEADYLLEQGVAHEIAHTWWGGLASSSDPAAAGFFAEAFAEYSARWALGRLQGEAVRAAANRMNAVWYMYRRPEGVDVPIIDPDVRESEAYVFVTYHKASVVLRTLEQAVGEERFTTVLRRLLAEGPNRLEIDSLVNALAEAGYDASADVDQWLMRSGYPTLTIGAALEEGLTLEISTDDPYHLELPVELLDGAGRSTKTRIQVGPGLMRHSLEEAPLLVRVDPEWTAVREVQPAVPGDVSFDGRVDGIDLLEVALHVGGRLPRERRRDGSYDPLYDLDGDRRIDEADLEMIGL